MSNRRRVAHPEDLGLLELSSLSRALRERNPNFTQELLESLALDQFRDEPYTKTIYVTKSAEKQLRKACSSILDYLENRVDMDWNSSESIMAKHGVVYIPVHLRAKTGEYLKKAIAMIKEHVGANNVCKTIEFPSKKKEIIYIKANTSRNLRLSIGKIRSRSIVDRIDIDYERLKASNGEIYILVNVTGFEEEAIQKAIVMIQDCVGIDNCEGNIDLLDDVSEDAPRSVRQSNTLYVKSSAKRHLDDDWRLNGIARRSGVDDILIEGESSISKIPKVIETTNGINYIVVNMRGDEDAIQKAIALIKEAVGINNVKDEIDLLVVKDEIELPTDPDSLIPVPPVEEASPKKTDSPSMLLQLIAAIMYEISLWMLESVVILACSFIIWTLRKVKDIQETLLTGTLMVFNFIYGIVKIPINMVVGRDGNSVENTVQEQQQQFEKTIYVKSSYKKKLTGKQGRKKKNLMNESGVNAIIVGTTILVGSTDDYVSVLLKGSEDDIQNAIGMIKDAIGTANVSCEKIDQPSHDLQTQTTSSTAAVSTDSEPQPNQEENLPDDISDDASVDTPGTQEQNKPNSMHATQELELKQQLRIRDEEEENRIAELTKQEEAAQQTHHQRVESGQLERNKAKTSKTIAFKTEKTVVKVDNDTEQAEDQEDASEINIVKEEEEDFYFTIDEPDDDPLLLFLQSQHQCIKGSVDEFYTWLVESEDIDSMAALKEAVSDDGYLNEKMKKGNGSSGVKGFKLKPFQRAVQEYDTKSTAYHHNLAQCQKKIISDNQEPPDELVCPISLVLMTNDPVVAADGITYERASIKDWFKKSKAKGSIIYSPVHGTKLKNLILTPNISLRNMARAFKDEK